ncbi:hypothetical protein LJE35_10940, partial [Clostridium butyricum]
SSVTGDFSLAAKGFMIENGKKTFPVEQITVAGNFFTLLKDIELKIIIINIDFGVFL